MVMVDKLCSFHNIAEGEITFGCDGLSVLNKAFSVVYILHPNKPSYDLIEAIKRLWAHSPIQ